MAGNIDLMLPGLPVDPRLEKMEEGIWRLPVVFEDEKIFEIDLS